MTTKNKLSISTPSVTGIRVFEKRKNSDIPTLEVIIGKTKYIRKDINMIQLPFFFFSDKKQYEVIKYKFGSDESKQMIVQAAARDKVPSTFEFEVIQVLLKFREAFKKKERKIRTDLEEAYKIWKKMNQTLDRRN